MSTLWIAMGEESTKGINFFSLYLWLFLKVSLFLFSFFPSLFKVIIFILILITINLALLDNSHQPIQQQMKITFFKCIQFLTIAKRKRKNDTSLGFRKFASSFLHCSCLYLGVFGEIILLDFAWYLIQTRPSHSKIDTKKVPFFHIVVCKVCNVCYTDAPFECWSPKMNGFRTTRVVPES